MHCGRCGLINNRRKRRGLDSAGSTQTDLYYISLCRYIQRQQACDNGICNSVEVANLLCQRADFPPQPTQIGTRLSIDAYETCGIITLSTEENEQFDTIHPTIFHLQNRRRNFVRLNLVKSGLTVALVF